MSRAKLAGVAAFVAAALGAAAVGVLAPESSDIVEATPTRAPSRPRAVVATPTATDTPILSLVAVSVLREEDGRPLAGALVIARAEGTDERAHTDARGQARFFLPPGAYRVSVPIGPDRAATQEVALAPTGAAVTLAVPTGHVVTGVVRGARGEPLPGVDIVAQFGEDRGARKGTTDATGAYRLAGLPGGEVSVEARALGTRELEQEVVRALPPTAQGLLEARQDFVFSAGAPCQGVVRDERGRAVPGVTVLAETTARFEPFEARTDISGRFRFPFALPGETARFEVEGEAVRQEAAVRRALLPGRSLEVELTVVAGGELTGRVVDARGVGFASARVLAEGDASGDEPVTATTDQDGRFRLAALSPGRYRCRVVCRGYADVVGPSHEVLVGRSVDVGALLLDEGVSAIGRVVDDRGRPSVDARVEYRRGDGREGHTLTDAAGAFVIDGLTAGDRLRLRATHGALAGSAAQEVAVAPAGVQGLTLVLETSPRLHGVVRDGAGAAVAGAWVAAVAEGAAPVRSGEDGRFSVTVGEAGPCALLVVAPGLRPARVQATADGGPLEVVLAPVTSSAVSGGVRGRLVLDGAPGRHVIVLARASASTGAPAVEVAAVDADGRFAVSLPGERGPWELLAMDLTGGEEQVLGQRAVAMTEASAVLEWQPSAP